MALETEQRLVESPYVERIWRGGGTTDAAHLLSVANSNWELVVTTFRDDVHVTVRGPETTPSVVELSPDPDFRAFGIIFRHGVSMAHLPVQRLVDAELRSPHATRSSFRLAGDDWEIPRYDNAEGLVERLVRAGLLVRDPLVSGVLAGDAEPLVTPRSVQRRVVAATGLTQGAIRQIERARQAAILLREGVTAADVVHRVGYFDHPHMARSLKRFMGRTGTQLQAGEERHELSLLYKTDTEVRP